MAIYLNGACKRMHREFVFYDRSLWCQSHEDRGRKHLYEHHHGCRGKANYCSIFCSARLSCAN